MTPQSQFELPHLQPTARTAACPHLVPHDVPKWQAANFHSCSFLSPYASPEAVRNQAEGASA